MKIKKGDLIVFPGWNAGFDENSAEAYIVSHVDKMTFMVSWNHGECSTSFLFSEAEIWFKRKSHYVISDKKEKLAYMLKYPDRIQS